nr:YigZ family protein [Cyclobacteriaceae bacterium]
MEVARNSINFKKSVILIKEPTYRIPVNTASAQFKEKGSKFLSFAFPVNTINEVTLHLACLKRSYPDATHHCYAWLIGLDKQQFKVQDDGEPSHSAGDSILGQIRSYGLTNVLVVVVRYYGGVNLGVGGLKSAYKTAATQALSLLAIQEIRKESLLIIEFDYGYTQLVSRMLKEKKIKIEKQHFTDKCEWHV